MALSIAEKTDVTNIGLMLVSCIVAMILPFEVFLFSYAILGPLHYLTEISWLHDKKFYTRERYDAIILIIIGFLITLKYYDAFIELDFPDGFDNNLMYIALLSAIIFVTVKNKLYRIGGILLVIFSSMLAQNYALFFGVFLPTLVHVYVFTALFMLYGALKSKSRFGIPAVIAMILCPILLMSIFPNKAFYPPTDYSIGAYNLFKIVNIHWLMKFNGIPAQRSAEAWDAIIFHSKAGILLMRFIAFAYTYHYLNWFSKTKIIQWHNIPKLRFAAVIIIWLISIGIYLTDYATGLRWLVFLSFLHVLLEFPLNVTSVIGIGSYFKERIFKSSAA
jgi:hypothetical protein